MTRPTPTPTAVPGPPAGLASFGQRLGAFVVDGVLADLISLLSGHRPGHAGYGVVAYLAFLLLELVFLSVAGQTPGMRVAGMAVVAVADGQRPKPWWALVRTVLLAVVVPALIPDGSGRPLHDRAAGTATVRVRGARG